ncbi:MAG TPA: tripartite tricarboxylate transporter substrate binding protein [Paracoccus sp. (in: a-proteobacteria)]|uniref:Bug family tripartite tricarboxylate transporter substrate binding protein n=1 Tax=uncultured Paracoccus sp. TaxID=189685 RepID=UPI0026226082|nr:tripartite tricarboxylate transporter substrate binding protein [uncultured Paracoccus sp.]HMQ40298.1 tripartite tricarboxylate transporter substrate binding protein [Paracoccus sp. (in: a-proteobacteria)]HMR35268.1 tripartite tricarboxylate transporter substrate binding protein [Paracoccus sp. (in: a-proteobacteria)]
MRFPKSAGLAATMCLSVLPLSAGAADWPSGPIELVIPSRPGGGTDIMGRIVADYLQQKLEVPVVVIDQPGGGGTIAFEQVRTATPDGQTLLFMHTGLLVNAHTGKYDHQVGDFTTTAIAQSYPPQVFAVGANAPWQTLRDFVEDARAHPGERTVGVSLGGSTHFIAGALMANEDIDLRLVEASAEVDKVAGVQGGHIDIGNLGAASARQFEEAGQMRVLCMIDPQPDPDYPDLETCQSQGVDITWLAPLVIWGPPGIPDETVQAINTAIAGMADDPTVQERLNAADSTFRAYSVEEAQALVADEDAKIAGLADSLGLAP